MSTEIESLENEVPAGAVHAAAKAEIVIWLQNRTNQLLERIQQEPFWKTVMDPNTPPSVVQTIMKEIYLEIVGYQPHVIEAAIAAIGQMPRSMNPRAVRSMLFHQADEFDHGEMALRDYIGLGGDEAYARSRRMSPPSYAVAGMWWMITRLRDPFAYLGALYLFEGLTPTVTGLVKAQLRKKGLTDKTLEYVEFHSTEDIKHANLVNHMIAEAVAKYPEQLESVKHGFECFEQVYPIPVWRCAYERAMTLKLFWDGHLPWPGVDRIQLMGGLEIGHPQNWIAIANFMPPGPACLRVRGLVQLPKPGMKARLVPNPSVVTTTQTVVLRCEFVPLDPGDQAVVPTTDKFVSVEWNLVGYKGGKSIVSVALPDGQVIPPIKIQNVW